MAIAHAVRLQTVVAGIRTSDDETSLDEEVGAILSAEAAHDLHALRVMFEKVHSS